MGDFRIEMNAVGGHGCQREVKDGGTVYGCGSMMCPDCITARYVADMKRTGAIIKGAKLTHWPGSKEEVVDEFDREVPDFYGQTLARRTRRGSLPTG